MGKEKRIKYANKEFYRIKDIETGEYYLARHASHYGNDLINKCKYSYKPKNAGDNFKYYLELDKIGHFYPTKHGAEKMLSEFTECSYSKRNTPAGRLLNSKLNFVVVKSQLKIKDIKE
jgi:hypothetical protein